MPTFQEQQVPQRVDAVKVVLVGSEGDCAKYRYRPYLDQRRGRERIEVFPIDRSRPVIFEPQRNIVPLVIQEDFDPFQDLVLE